MLIICIKLNHEVKWSEVAQLYPTFCDPMDCSLPGSSVHGIFQAIVLEWIAISFSRGSSRPRDRTQVSRIVDRRFTVWATREVLEELETDFIDVAYQLKMISLARHVNQMCFSLGCLSPLCLSLCLCVPFQSFGLSGRGWPSLFHKSCFLERDTGLLCFSLRISM